jgi:hypothetical protein
MAEKYGRGKRIRTSEWRDQNPLPYHLAIPLWMINDRVVNDSWVKG